jgi:hypothetical protein
MVTGPGSGETGELPRRLTQDEYVRLCRKAFGNLPGDTTVTFDDVDAILAWCLPEWMLPRE